MLLLLFLVLAAALLVLPVLVHAVVLQELGSVNGRFLTAIMRGLVCFNPVQNLLVLFISVVLVLISETLRCEILPLMLRRLEHGLGELPWA